MLWRSGERRRDERGDTLVELLVAVVILGVAGVAVMAGLEMSVRSSSIGRNQATSGSYVRSWAEKIQASIDDPPSGNPTLPSCSTAAGTYKSLGDAMIAADASNLAGYTASLATDSVQTAQVMSWNGTGWGACSDGNGTQRVKLKLVSSGNTTHRATETLVVILRKPCEGAVPSPANLGAVPC